MKIRVKQKRSQKNGRKMKEKTKKELGGFFADASDLEKNIRVYPSVFLDSVSECQCSRSRVSRYLKGCRYIITSNMPIVLYCTEQWEHRQNIPHARPLIVMLYILCKQKAQGVVKAEN